MTDTQKSKGRSAVTNGKRLLTGIDGRSKEARRHRDLLDSFAIEFNAVSESELSQCRLAADLQLQCELEAAKRLRGEPIDEGALVTAGNALRRHLRDLRASARRRSARA